MEIKIQRYEEVFDGVSSGLRWLVSFSEGGSTTSHKITPEEMFDLEQEVKRSYEALEKSRREAAPTN